MMISCNENKTEKEKGEEKSIDIYTLNYDKANELLERTGQTSEYISYVGKTIEFNNADKILEKGSCGAYTGKTLLISILDSNGQILRTIPQGEK